MVESYFIMDGIHSKDLGIKVIKLPKISRAKERVNKYEIAGRSGSLYEFENTFDNYQKTVECILLPNANIDNLFNVLRGTKEFIFSNELDKKYKVMISNVIDLDYVLRKYKSFILQFDTFPFKYSASELADFLEITKATTIYNKGNLKSEPIITIFGRGDINININNKIYSLSNVNEKITINSEIMEVYKNNENQNNKYTADDFPLLDVGENNISWSGEVVKIEIEPKWRWL